MAKKSQQGARRERQTFGACFAVGRAPRALGRQMVAPLANGTTAFEGRALLYDYVPWEQMTKQRRGLMWAFKLAHELDRTLVLPPLRFHTKASNDASQQYEYARYSYLFELQPLAELHPITELDDFLADSGGRIDHVFSILRGMPKGYVSAMQNTVVGEWVEGECSKSSTADAECEVDESGEEVCSTPLASFAGSSDSVRVRNLTCGWAPDMRWDRILRDKHIKHVLSVGIDQIVYQIPPPKSVASLSQFFESTRAGRDTCGWRCPYELIRSAMVYKRRLVEAARSYLLALRQRHAALEYASGDGRLELGSGDGSNNSGGSAAESVRVLAIHWRRGDFLSRAGLDHACHDEATGYSILDTKTNKPCVKASIVLTPEALALEVHEQMRLHNASVVFLASNAKPEEIRQLEAALQGTAVVRYEPPSSSSTDEPKPPYSPAELAVIDTLVCALSDAFLGTRRSMFSWNILEERVLQGRVPTSGALMGLPRGRWRIEQPAQDKGLKREL